MSYISGLIIRPFEIPSGRKVDGAIAHNASLGSGLHFEGQTIMDFIIHKVKAVSQKDGDIVGPFVEDIIVEPHVKFRFSGRQFKIGFVVKVGKVQYQMAEWIADAQANDAFIAGLTLDANFK